MTEQELLTKMVAPGQRRANKWLGGVIQIHVTRSCDKACYGCTQLSQLGGKTTFITPDQFRTACRSLKGYFGVVGLFGGNPALHPQFEALCEIMREEVPFEQRGLWCNNPINASKVSAMRQTFNPAVSNLNVHLDKAAYDLFKSGWPESMPFGLQKDSRHSPCYVAMKDLDQLPEFDAQKRHVASRPNTEENRHALIADCDINQHWSAMIGVFRGKLRAWFCEIAGAQAMAHQDEPDYPDTGISIEVWDNPPGSGLNITAVDNTWWTLPMKDFAHQVRKHCHECSVPLRGYGELAQQADDKGKEQVSPTHASLFKPKRKGRAVELVTTLDQVKPAALNKMIDYLGNSVR